MYSRYRVHLGAGPGGVLRGALSHDDRQTCNEGIKSLPGLGFDEGRLMTQG